MRKKKIRLYLRFRQSDGKQSPHCPGEYDSKSRLCPFRCFVHGVSEHHPEAAYYQRIKREGKWSCATPRQIQKWLSHTSLETTLRYLGTIEDTADSVRDIVNSVHAGL